MSADGVVSVGLPVRLGQILHALDASSDPMTAFDLTRVIPFASDRPERFAAAELDVLAYLGLVSAMDWLVSLREWRITERGRLAVAASPAPDTHPDTPPVSPVEGTSRKELAAAVEQTVSGVPWIAALGAPVEGTDDGRRKRVVDDNADAWRITYPSGGAYLSDEWAHVERQLRWGHKIEPLYFGAPAPVVGSDDGRSALAAAIRSYPPPSYGTEPGDYAADLARYVVVHLSLVGWSLARVGSDDEPAAWPDGMYETAAMALYRSVNASMVPPPTAWSTLNDHDREEYRRHAAAVADDLTEHLRYLIRPESPAPVGQTVTDDIVACPRCDGDRTTVEDAIGGPFPCDYCAQRGVVPGVTDELAEVTARALVDELRCWMIPSRWDSPTTSDATRAKLVKAGRRIAERVGAAAPATTPEEGA